MLNNEIPKRVQVLGKLFNKYLNERIYLNERKDIYALRIWHCHMTLTEQTAASSRKQWNYYYIGYRYTTFFGKQKISKGFVGNKDSRQSCSLSLTLRRSIQMKAWNDREDFVL